MKYHWQQLCNKNHSVQGGQGLWCYFQLFLNRFRKQQEMKFVFIATFFLTLYPKAFTLKCRVCKTQVGNLTLIGTCANATDNGVIEDCQPPNDQCWFTNGSKYMPCFRTTEKLIIILKLSMESQSWPEDADPELVLTTVKHKMWVKFPLWFAHAKLTNATKITIAIVKIMESQNLFYVL